MIKKQAFLWLLLAVLLFVIPAIAETYVLDEIYASIEVPDTYVVLTPENLSGYADWLEARGSSMEECTNDFIRRGVLLQAWNVESNLCFEVRAISDEKTQLIFDVNEQSTSVRGEYRTSHYPDNLYEGYDFSSSDWKNTTEGRFLVLKYIRRDSGEILYRGLMRRTIRNGYQIDCDMQVYGRATTNQDNSALNKLWETLHFIEILDMPAAASANINISSPPPTETNEKSFNIKGTAASGVSLTMVVRGMMSSTDPVVTSCVVEKNGKFSLPVSLSKEGVFVITLQAEYQGKEVYEAVYPVTYESTLLTVNFTVEPGTSVSENEVSIKGTSVPGASIQMFVNEESVGKKKVTAQGKFALTFDTPEEGEYTIALVFSKKGLEDRRFSWKVTRRWTEEDTMNYLSKQAVKPAYQTLLKKIDGYTGRIMGYDAYLVNVSKSGDGYALLMALHRKNKVYSQYIMVMAKEEPSFAIDEKVRMYGTCEGMSDSSSDPDGVSYPCFSLLLLATLE